MAKKKKKSKPAVGAEYTADDLQHLSDRDHVRERPAMYIGDISSRGLHHLVYEVVDNAIDEALAGFCDRITVSLHIDTSVTVVDNGRGIPIDQHESGKSAAEVMERMGIQQVDESELVGLCEELLAANPKTVADLKAGKTKAVGVLIGQAKKRNPNVDPGRVREICLNLVQ